MAINLQATLSLVDNMTRPLRQMSRQLNSFRSSTELTRDANGRLRDSMGRFASANRGVSSSFGAATSSAHNYTASLGTLAAGIAGVVGAQKLLNATVGEAMKMEQSQVVIEAMIDDKKLSKQYMDMMDKLAIESPLLNSQDMYANSLGIVSLTKNLEKPLAAQEDTWKLVERLTALNPNQAMGGGVEGAVYALRALASQDIISLQDRFNLDKNVLNDLKKLSFEEQIVGLSKYLDEIGIGEKTIKDMGGTSLGVINQIKEALAVKFRAVGFEALEHLKPVILDIEKAVSSGKLDGFFKSMGSVFAKLGAEAKNFSNYIKTNWHTIQANIAMFKEALAPVGNAFLAVYGYAKKVGDYIVQNWATIQPIILGVAGAFVAFKVIGTVIGIVRTAITVFGALKRAFAIAKTAFTLLRLSMLLFPGGWIIAAIGAVVLAGIWLYKNWDLVKKKALELWAKIKQYKDILLALMGPIGSVISIGIKLYQNWDKIKAKGTEVWNSVKKTIGDAMDSAKTKVANFFEPLLGFIDTVKSKWSDFTSAIKNFEMPSFSMPSFGGLIGGGDGSGHAGGLSNVPYNGYHARLHKGERVLTKEENSAYSRGIGGGNTYKFGNIIIQGGPTDRDTARRLLNYIADEIESAGGAGA